jgi:hypothetical protein
MMMIEPMKNIREGMHGKIEGKRTQSGALPTRVIRLNSALADSFLVSQKLWAPLRVNTPKTG